MRYKELFESSLTPEQASQILKLPMVHRGVKISPNLRLWRGTNENSGSNAASFGSGLYFTADKRVAKDFAGDNGKIHDISFDMLPKNPLRFKTRQDFEIWLQTAIFNIIGYKRRSEFTVDYHDFKEFVRALDPSIDGIQMYLGKDAEFVNYDAPRITEDFAGAFVPFYSKDKTPCEVFKNPSKQEFRKVEGKNDQVRAFIVGDDLYVWNVYQSLHQTVREELKLPEDSISLTISGKVGADAYVSVTDNVRHTRWFHNPEVADAIYQNPWIARLFNEIEIDYFDDGIWGDWANLQDEEPEENDDEDEEDLDEDVSPNTNNMIFDEISRIEEEYGVNLQCTVNNTVVHILSLTRKSPIKGAGTKALEELLNLTDMLGLNVTLTAAEGHPRLIRYYMAHGFQIANVRPQDAEKWLHQHAMDWDEAVQNGEDLNGVSMIHYAD